MIVHDSAALFRFRAKGTSERVKFPYVQREPQRESSSLTCEGNLRESQIPLRAKGTSKRVLLLRRHHTLTRESRAYRRSPRAFLSTPPTTKAKVDGALLRRAASIHARRQRERAATVRPEARNFSPHENSFNFEPAVHYPSKLTSILFMALRAGSWEKKFIIIDNATTLPQKKKPCPSLTSTFE